MRLLETGRLKWLFGRYDVQNATEEAMHTVGPLAREVIAYMKGVTKRPRETVRNLAFLCDRISYLLTPGVMSLVRTDFALEETNPYFDPVEALQKHGMYYHRGEFRVPVRFQRIPLKKHDSFPSVAVALTELLAQRHPQEFTRLHAIPDVTPVVTIDSVGYTKKTSYILKDHHDFTLRAEIVVRNVPSCQTQPVRWDTLLGTLQFVIADRLNR